ncbi:hypothetical protein SAMN04487949_1531 [Halogranum gelatinilyticum]|uniref:Uncharacterized protein n=1 Tax=Halogranum gelatinilyticum TaxID=660521 RepID=A0A1G9SX17_9EURY|nr:hypothetical protein [Halogranum gelatinilyticum]SDM39960.1 hypothetical protein SAMN04487949_1531 [Halogranum gelatinilyticum]
MSRANPSGSESYLGALRERGDESVMAAVDGEGRRAELVIADTERDDAWLSVDVDDAPSLDEWR